MKVVELTKKVFMKVSNSFKKKIIEMQTTSVDWQELGFRTKLSTTKSFILVKNELGQDGRTEDSEDR